MKKTFFATIMVALLVSCQIETTQENIIPAYSKLAGKWKLYKIVLGYPMLNGPSEIKNTYEEILEFNATSKTFSRIVDGKTTETSNFDVKPLTNGLNETSPRDAIVFTKTNTYSYLSFDEKTSSLILSQSTPIGAVLADGNSFYYQKVQ
jgi:hypothetical protein